MRKLKIAVMGIMTISGSALLFQDKAADRLAPPVEMGKWIVPAQGRPAEPVWGIRGGIAVGLWPTGGPRGLIRIYAPYLGQPRLQAINFIAIEPVVGGIRGFSELESSDLDNTRGKRIWSSNELLEEPKSAPAWEPAGGKLIKIGTAEALTFFLYVERFQNGACPIIQVILRGDRPYEVGFKVFAAKSSEEMKYCILTATMGNYARLRYLWLKGEVIDSRKLWAGEVPHISGFLPARQWGVERLLQVKGDIIVAATPNESEPAKALYGKEVPPWWRYQGKVATQYWRKPNPHQELVVRVNGRKTYWGTEAEIPGGIAYENFELEEPFSVGQEFWFGVTPRPPERLGFNPRWRKHLTDGK